MTTVLVAVAILGLVVLALVVGVPFFFNRLSPMVDARRRARDDGYFLAECASGALSRYRWLNRRFPTSPRCRFCLVPFGGLGRILRVRPSRKNPNFCSGCFEMAPLGGTDMEVGVLFADLRGFTSWSERQTPHAVEHALNRFYRVTTTVITEADGLVDKLVGDEVMGLYLTAFSSLGDRTCEVMLHAAEQIVRRLHAVGEEDGLPVGIGINFGMARVGNVGAGEVKDFTAVGDVVNTAARLQACAHPGEVVIAEAAFKRLGGLHPNAPLVFFDVKGKADAVAARVLTPDAVAST